MESQSDDKLAQGDSSLPLLDGVSDATNARLDWLLRHYTSSRPLIVEQAIKLLHETLVALSNGATLAFRFCLNGKWFKITIQGIESPKRRV